jgi:hypothetical protein
METTDCQFFLLPSERSCSRVGARLRKLVRGAVRLLRLCCDVLHRSSSEEEGDHQCRDLRSDEFPEDEMFTRCRQTWGEFALPCSQAELQLSMRAAEGDRNKGTAKRVLLPSWLRHLEREESTAERPGLAPFGAQLLADT